MFKLFINSEMLINYLIIAHRNLTQLDRLITSLDDERVRFFIHVDKKVPGKEIKKYMFCENKRVHLIRNRILVNWAGFSIVMATLKLMQAASARGSGYFVLLSGEDFPLKSNDFIYNFLLNSYGKEFICFSPLPYEKWKTGGMERINYYWMGDHIDYNISNFFLEFQKFNKLERTYFKDFPPYGGSQWWCLTYECVLYILKFIKYNPLFVDYFKFTLCPDEMFFHTIILNSEYKTKTINDNLKYISHKKNRDHPEPLNNNDLTTLINSEKLWARKFDILYDSTILDKIESHISTSRY